MNLVSFDFDGTLLFTSEPEEGKKIFKFKTGLDWPHMGWWSKPETLNMEIFPTPLNPWVYREYLKWSEDKSNHVMLVTGRLERMRREVELVLSEYELSFDDIKLNPGGIDTFIFKTKLFEQKINEHSPEMLIMYDDRLEHLHKFGIWAESQRCKIKIINVVNKTEKIFN